MELFGQTCPFDQCQFWTIIFDGLVSALFVVGIGAIGTAAANKWYRRRKYDEQEAVLHRLADLRSEGVEIRNDGWEVLTGTAFIDWNTRIGEWEDDLEEAAKKLSLVEAERLKTLDFYPLLDPNEVLDLRDKDIGDDQLRVLSETSETLKRLDHMLELRFRPKMAP